MEQFEHWHQKLTSFIDNECRVHLKNISKNNNKILLIYGEKNSGKNILIKHICKKFLENDTQIIMYEHKRLVAKKYPFEIQKNITVYDLLPDLSLSTTGMQPTAEVTLSLSNLYKRFSNTKLNNILYFKDIKEDDNISIDIIQKISSSIPGKSVIIITTSDKQIFDDFIENRITKFCMPKVVFGDENFQNYETPILNKLKTLSIEDCKQIIDLTKGNYGDIKLLLNQDIDLFINQFHDVKSIVTDNVEKNIKKLTLAIFLLSDLLSEEALEIIFADTDYDYISEYEEMIKRNWIDSRYKFNDLIYNSKEQFIKNFYNKRIRRDIALKLENYLKSNFPEKYFLRASIIKGIDDRKYEGLLRLSSLRKNNLNRVDDKFINFITDSSKNEHDYMMFNKSKLTLIELAEFQIHFINHIMNSSPRNYEMIHLIIIELFDIYQKLVEEKEIELAIRVGLIISIGGINYNILDKLDAAKKVYFEVTYLINEKIAQNNKYYIPYSIYSKIMCTGFKSYHESYYILYGLVNDLRSEEYNSSNVNTEEILPIVISNFIGISMYLGVNKMNHAQKLYNDNLEILGNFQFKKFKLENNLMLLSIFLNNNINNDLYRFKKKFQKKTTNTAFKINYAGVLFETEQTPRHSLSILEEILKQDEGTDDFYQFYCNYNICIIKLKLGQIEDIEGDFRDLKVPALFTDKIIRKEMEKRVKFLKNYLLDSSKSHTWLEFQKVSHRYFRNFEGIFSHVWAFTDIQYWNDVIQ